MGARPVSAKLVRRIARETGRDVVWASGHGGIEFAFVTADHQHGVWNKRTGAWHWSPRDNTCPASCRTLFPPGAAPLTPDEMAAAAEHMRGNPQAVPA